MFLPRAKVEILRRSRDVSPFHSVHGYAPPTAFHLMGTGVKRLVLEADCSPPYNVNIKNAWNQTSAPSHILKVWCLIECRESRKFLQNILN
jgi:hypothetical protein